MRTTETKMVRVKEQKFVFLEQIEFYILCNSCTHKDNYYLSNGIRGKNFFGKLEF